MRFRVQVLNRDRALLRFEERGLVPGLVMVPERGHERPLCPVPYRRPLRLQERGPFRGQGLPQPYRGREKLGQCRSQNADIRSLNSPKNKNL